MPLNYSLCNADIRAETWKYLLDYMPFDKADGFEESGTDSEMP